MGYATGNYELPKLFIGPDAASQLAAIECDVVVNGITGAVGLQPTVAALKAGTTLALANKESLVIGGVAVTSLAKPGQIVPVDSEHSALAQCLRSGSAAEVRKLILTASGGPFRGRTRDELADVTVEQALAHPTWAMGPVVTINSSTMMNKGLEIIEAHLLFDIPMDRIEVVVHPQSIVHSMVEFVDGSTIAQVSPPDMHLPIALGLTWPERLPDSTTAVDWQQASTWTFEPVDEEVFPAVALARRVGTLAGTAPAVMNAANEVAVDEFLLNRLGYLEIVQLVTQVVDEHLRDGFVADDVLTLEAVVQAAQWAHEYAQSLVHARA
jgi:1-deoxy-D-xylulose-5-phosphate reductoisomerase